jgi:hypothetical protein
MPHVVIEDAGPLSEAFAAFQPIVSANGNEILKVNEAFLSRRGSVLLLEAVAIEKPDAQAFLVQVSLKDRAVTVRLLPATDPQQKTPGVKRLLGLVARFLRGVYPGSRFGKTNLQGFLEEPGAPL